jgi:hypothetical protein
LKDGTKSKNKIAFPTKIEVKLKISTKLYINSTVNNKILPKDGNKIEKDQANSYFSNKKLKVEIKTVKKALK